MDPRTQAPSRELAPGASDRTSEDVAVPTPPCVDAMLRARARGSGDRWRACVNRPLAPSSSQIDPLGHTNGWSTATRRRPAGSHLLDHLAVGTHHRVLQPKLFERGQDPSEVGVHTERSPHVRRTGGNRGQGAARSGGSRGRDWSGCARWVVLEADHQPAGFGLAAFRVHPIRTMWPLDCAVLMTPGTTPDPPGRRAVGPMTAGCSRGGREGRSVCRGSRRPRWGGPSDRGRALGDGSPDRCGRWEL